MKRLVITITTRWSRLDRTLQKVSAIRKEYPHADIRVEVLAD